MNRGFFSVVFLVSLVLVCSTIWLGSEQRNAIAQTSPSVTFVNAAVDTNPIPNKPFKVNATISVQDPNGRNVLVGIAVNNGLSVTSPVIVDLGFMTPGSQPQTATWNLIANSPGSYTIVLTASSSNSAFHASDSTSFQLNFSVGSAKGLVVTAVNIPGSISPTDIFNVGIQLKNTGVTSDTDVIVTLAAPTGVHVLEGVGKNIPMINPDQQVFVNWTMMADTTGSFPLTFNFVSTNSGSNSFTATVNVGSINVADVLASKILLAGSDPTSNTVGPGDMNLPLLVNLTNVGSLWIYNMDAKLVLNDPMYWQDSNGNSTQVFNVQQLGPGKSIDALFFVSVRESAVPNVYQSHIQVSYNDKTQQFVKSIVVPITISPKPVLTVDAHKTLVVANNITQIVFDVVNTGSVSVHNLKVLSNSGVYTSVDTPIWIGDLGIASKHTVSMKIFTIVQTVSLVPLPLTLSYEAGGKTYNNTFQIALDIQGQPNFQIHSVKYNPSSIYPGATGTRIDIDVLNSGQGIAHNVSTALNLPAGITPAWGNATSIYQGNVLPSSDFVASFFVNVSPEVRSGVYAVTLNLNYAEGSSKVPVAFDISPKAAFVLINVDDSQLYPGATNVPLKLLVKNIGNYTAGTITAKLLGGNSIPGVKSNTITSVGDVVNAGNIVPGQSAPLTFVVNVDPTFVSGAHATSVEIQWTQNGTDSFVQTVTVPYHLSSGPSFLLYYQGIPITYLIVLGIVAAALIAFLVARRRRNDRISLAIETKDSPKAIEDDYREPRIAGAPKALEAPDDDDLR